MVGVMWRAMVEAWPLRPSRGLLNFQAFMPSVTDRLMGRYFRQIDKLKRS